MLVIVLAFLLQTSFIFKFTGNSGVSIISRVMGLILSSVAIASILGGLVITFRYKNRLSSGFFSVCCAQIWNSYMVSEPLLF